MKLSHSRLKTYRRCPKRYEFKYIMGLEPRRPALTLKRGSWLHELLMVHYDEHSWVERQAELTRDFNTLFEEEREEYGDLPGETQRIFMSYLMHWHEEDKKLHVIDSEVDEFVTLPNGDIFNFIIDLIVEDPDGGLWLWDHKSVKNFMPPDFMLLDAQLARYFWAAMKLGYTPLRGVIFNELITAPPTVPELLKNGRLTERQNLRCDVYTYFREIKRQKQDPKSYASTLRRLQSQSDRWFRRTRLPRDKPLMIQMMREMLWTADSIKHDEATGHFARTPMKDCTWDCPFLDPCMIQLSGGTIDEVLRLKYTTRADQAKEDSGY